VQPIIEVFLAKRKRGGKLVSEFDLNGGIPPPKPPGLEGSIYMCSCNLLEFLNSHIGDREGGKVTVNLGK
jgi:hypothetical protein